MKRTLNSKVREIENQIGLYGKWSESFYYFDRGGGKFLLFNAGAYLLNFQELIGIKSRKASEIQTHVSEKSLQKINYHFDDL